MPVLKAFGSNPRKISIGIFLFSSYFSCGISNLFKSIFLRWLRHASAEKRCWLKILNVSHFSLKIILDFFWYFFIAFFCFVNALRVSLDADQKLLFKINGKQITGKFMRYAFGSKLKQVVIGIICKIWLSRPLLLTKGCSVSIRELIESKLSTSEVMISVGGVFHFWSRSCIDNPIDNAESEGARTSAKLEHTSECIQQNKTLHAFIIQRLWGNVL